MRVHPFAYLIMASILAASCADDDVTQTGEINVWSDPTAPFEDYETFSVVTADNAPPPPDAEPLTDEEERFNEQVNAFIIEAMQNPPVCLEFIPPEDVNETNLPDVFAANGLAVQAEEGYFWQCIGGWWWGYWGWYWDPCKWVVPVPVEVDVGSMLIPVGPPPPENEDPEPTFAGLAQTIVQGPTVDEQAVQNAVNFIFSQWPDQRECERVTTPALSPSTE